MVRHMILPWTVLALLYIAIYARLTRNNLLETLGEDYIRTARAKGLSERRVILKHGLRASLTPIVTIFGLDMALLVGGAIITESVFNIQGLGWLAFNGALTQDLPTCSASSSAPPLPSRSRTCSWTSSTRSSTPASGTRRCRRPRQHVDTPRRPRSDRALQDPGRCRPGGLGPLVHPPPRRDPRRRRRVRVGQERHQPGDHGAPQPRDRRDHGRDPLRREGSAEALAGRVPRRARARRLDDLPGPVRLSAPDVPGRLPDRRGRARSREGVEGQGLGSRGRAARRGRDPERQERGRRTIHTSSRAGCGSAR